MAIFQGVDKKLAYKRQTGLGVSAIGAGGQLLRRTTSTINLTKETYKSNEIRPDMQVSDMRHGARQVTGSLSGEVSCATYKEFMESVLRGRFAVMSYTGATGLTLTVSAVSGGVQTITSTAFFTKGLRVGHVAEFSVATGGSTNTLNNRFLIVAASDTVLTVKTIGGTPLDAAALTTATIIPATSSKSVFVPDAGSTFYNDYYTIEHFFDGAGTDRSELFTDVKPTNLQVKIPSNGMATVDIPLIGLDMATNTAQQLTTPTAITTTGIESGVNGVISVGGVALGIITSIDFDVNGNNAAADGVVGSVVRPDVFNGSITASGTLTVHFDDAANGAVALRDAFLNETAVTVSVVLSEQNSKATDFIAFTLPRVKFSGADVDDTQTGLKRTMPFTALKNDVTESTSSLLPKTTVFIQDSKS